jgi:hypothetical protein
MNDHGYFLEKLSAFADHELAPDLQAQVAEHVETCAECQRGLEQLRQLDRFVDDQSELDDSDYWETAARKIEAQLPATPSVTDIRSDTKTEPVGWAWKLPAIAASVLIVGYIGLHQSEILEEDIGRLPSEAAEIVQPTEKRAVDEVKVAPEAIGQVDAKDHQEEQPLTGANESDTRSVIPAPSPIVFKPALFPEKPTADLARQSSGQATPPPAASGSDDLVALPDIVATPGEVVKVEPEAPVARAKRGSRPAPSAASPDANYKRRSKIKSAASAQAKEERQKIQLTLADQPDRSDSDQFGDDGEAGILALSNLDDWRHLRDSLQEALPKLAAGSEATAQKQGLGFEAISSLAERSNEAVIEADKNASKQGEASLVEAWYQICRLTDDSSEADEGLRFLRQKAADSTATSRAKAALCLKLLGKQ